MPNFGVFPLPSFLATSSALTTNTTSAAFTLPLSSCYRMTVELLTASSTTTSFNVGLFASDDNGTTYHGILNTTALTTSGQGTSILFRPFLGPGDLATAISAPILGTVDYTSAQQVANNGPFDPRFLKLRYLVSSNGTVTFNVKVTSVPQDLSD